MPMHMGTIFFSDFFLFINEYFYRTVRYPKSGEVNPTSKLYVRNIAENKNKIVNPPIEVLSWGEYIYTRVTWASDDAIR